MHLLNFYFCLFCLYFSILVPASFGIVCISVFVSFIFYYFLYFSASLCIFALFLQL